MTNPSTVWAQLALPLSPVGSIPFVFTDSATIVIDSINFSYLQSGATKTGSQQDYQLTVAGGVRVTYTDTTASTGAQVINKPAGRVKFAAGTSSVVITSSYAYATSIIHIQDETGDATAIRFKVTPAAGSFTITANANFTSAGNVTFLINNVF